MAVEGANETKAEQVDTLRLKNSKMQIFLVMVHGVAERLPPSVRTRVDKYAWPAHSISAV
jgi:hypothetical protein